jgi:2-methylcitrate dehydratase PrpD
VGTPRLNQFGREGLKDMGHELTHNADLIGEFLAETRDRTLPEDVRDAAKRCLVDWTGVTIAGSTHPAARAVAEYAALKGSAVPVLGPTNDPEKAALVNGVAAHALDFDDTHITTDSHFSAVTWATVLALAGRPGVTGELLLKAFVAGYEVAAKLAGRRMGFALQFRCFHPSGILGRLAAAAAAAPLYGLDAGRAAHAVALVMTRAGGLRSSLGSMGKPFQVGSAAMDGVVCARLAEVGYGGALGLLEPNSGFDSAFVQDGSAQLATLSSEMLGRDWAVLRTSFKPYACLHGIHPSIDAALQVATQIDPNDIAAVHVYVAPGVKKVGHVMDPQTPLEAKFSVAFCVALALSGHTCGSRDFTEETLADPVVRRLQFLVVVHPEEGRKMLDSAVEVIGNDRRKYRGETMLSRGHPGNPLSWGDLDLKFLDLAAPILGEKAALFLAILKEIDKPGALDHARVLLLAS